jgi:alanine racemase
MVDGRSSAGREASARIGIDHLPIVPRVIATIDLGAVRHNLARVRQFAPQSKVMAAIKADGYGHGALPLATTLAGAGVDALAVACLEEALVLRQGKVQTPLVLLEGVLSLEEARIAVAESMQIVIHDRWQLALIAALPASEKPQLWFKLDSGMHRLGFPLAEVSTLTKLLAAHPQWSLQGWMTHLACAEDGSSMTPQQIAAFETALRDVAGPRSIANSAGLIAWPQARADWVRPGLMLYGASPMPATTAAQLGLRPAMHLESRLISLRDLESGQPVGYGAAYISPAPMRIGIAAVGYADGVHRGLPSGTPVLINGVRAPMVGRVSMDMIAIDLREVPNAQIGDAVTLWGNGLPAEEIAVYAGTLAYELFCGLTRRVHFRYQ